MDWIKIIENALRYIEENLSGELTVGRIAEKVNISPFYFQKGFSLVCGYGVGEYISNRRLTLAAYELLHTNHKIIDIAFKYGFDVISGSTEINPISASMTSNFSCGISSAFNTLSTLGLIISAKCLGDHPL